MTERYNLAALEFQTVRDALVQRLITPLGRVGIDRLAPLSSVREVQKSLTRVDQLARRQSDGEGPPIPHLNDMRSWLPGFFAGDRQPSLGELVDLKRLLATAARCRVWLSAEPTLEELCSFATAFPQVRDIAEELGTVIDESGEVSSTASTKLGEIRQEIGEAELGLRRAVQKFLASDRIYKHLQNPEPSWRHGRPVFQVKQEARGAVPGILHDRSSSGATLFIEPESVVPAANVLSDIRAAEHREVQVVLARVCRELRRYESDITAAVSAVVDLDVDLAKASLIRESGYQVPQVDEEGVLRLDEARHPLLLRTMPSEEIQPLSLVLGDSFTVLVVTGPNTGGKTVVLKTIGLLTVMALSGIPIPAKATSRVPFCDGVFVDVGDEQGIVQNLSTFSSHVKRIAECLESATDRSLVLLDELGSGTDPEEGGALGYAVLRDLETRRVRAVVTTHLGRLKEFAYQHAGAENGSMAFDRQNHTPLYRLELGIPGASHALDIAEVVGMPSRIVEVARGMLSQRDHRLEEEIERVHTARLQAEANRQRSGELVQSANEKESLLAEKLIETERRRAWLEEEADSTVDAALKGTRDLIEEALKEFGNAPKPFCDKARALHSSVLEHLRGSSVHRRRMRFLGGLRKGDAVYVARLGRRCSIVKLNRRREVLTVEYGKMRVEVPFEDVSWLQPMD